MLVYVLDDDKILDTDKSAHDFSSSCECSVYARHIVVNVGKTPDLDVINSIKGVFDAWTGDGLHIVFNPLETTIEDIARELLSQGLEPVLRVEEDVRYIL
ncbi:hypothetical protein GCM10007981_11770 [Thermocladium modestius]|uniref:Uncharacterized protein n=1 Tax=Thermocladium modestius TaxID=62609 RepID=A0A830GWM5_9CREN|nr:hypothetical protein [Thermocladium modestius]GGP21146.1 hypothetical protein GCM10007981_11770 [Thermocladium modestius]